VYDALHAKLDTDGVVTPKGAPRYTGTGRKGVSSASGIVNVNPLWGGDPYNENYRATVDMNKHKVTGLRLTR
jgi:hypothetical protein